MNLNDFNRNQTPDRVIHKQHYSSTITPYIVLDRKKQTYIRSIITNVHSLCIDLDELQTTTNQDIKPVKSIKQTIVKT